MIPKQRGGGSPKYGNTSWGHRSNRVTSGRRGGNAHAGGGGGGNKGGGGICGLQVAGTAAFLVGIVIGALGPT